MSSDWVRASLDRLAEINPVRKVRKGDLVPFVDMAALPQFSRDIGQGGVVFREAKGAGAHFRNGDTLLARITPCLENGKTAQVRLLEGDAIGEGSTEFIVLCGKDPADNDFVYYVCRDPTFREYAISRMEGTSGRQRVSWQAVAGYELDVAPKQERRGVAVILTSLDDRITLLRETNQTLEAIAQAIFKSWFVDFDPVRAKMEGRQPTGMDEETAALFPDELVESELGLIPKGWEFEAVESVMEFKEGPGIRNWQYTNTTEGTRFINIRCIKDGDLDLQTANRISNDEANGKYAHFQLQPMDVVVSTSGTLGRSAIVRPEHLPLVVNTSVIRFRPVSGKTHFCFIHQYLNSVEFLSKLEAMASGSVQKNFGPMHLKQMKLLYPGFKLISKYEITCRPLIERMISARSTAEQLAQLRDTLLPRLISGKLRVPVDETHAVTNEE
jgi:type I restriction enzyme S subunit